MTNRQWLMWQLIEMSDEELLSKFPELMCDVCAKHIPSNIMCKGNCRSAVLAWLKEEHEEGHQ